MRFVEFILLIISLGLFCGTDQRKLSAGFLAGGLGLNLIDQSLVSRKLKKQEDRFVQFQDQILLLSAGRETNQKETQILEGRVRQVEDEYQALHQLIGQIDLGVRRQVLVDSETKNSLAARLLNLESIDIEAITHTMESLQKLDKQVREVAVSLSIKSNSQVESSEFIEKEIAKQIKQNINLIKAEIQSSITEQFIQINQTLKELDYEQELVYDRAESRGKLLEAFKKAEKRIIIVCPWPDGGIHFNHNELKKVFINFLEHHSEAIIDMGWGKLKDINKYEKLKERKKIAKPLDEYLKTQEYYGAAKILIELKQAYPGRFRYKIIGTHEKIVVCDQQFTMFGSHNFLTSGDEDATREIGIYTTNQNIIKSLIERFDSAKDWNCESS
jgi:hypothetical protein